MGLCLCRDAFARGAWRDKARVFDMPRLRNMAVVNTDILIRSVLLQAIFVSFLFWGADFGDVQLAANQILLQFLNVTAYALDGFAAAAESLVGQALGAKNAARLRRGAILTSGWGTAICAGLTLLFALAGPSIIDIMTTAPEVQTTARHYLPYMVAAPIVGVASWMFDGIFIGATRTRDMRNMMVVSAIVYFAAVIPLMWMFGNHGLWIGLLLSFVVRGITLGWKYPALEASAR